MFTEMEEEKTVSSQVQSGSDMSQRFCNRNTKGNALQAVTGVGRLRSLSLRARGQVTMDVPLTGSDRNKCPWSLEHLQSTSCTGLSGATHATRKQRTERRTRHMCIVLEYCMF